MDEQEEIDLQDGWCQTVELPVKSNWELVQQVLAQRKNPIPPDDPRYASAAFYRNSTWTPGQTVKIGFLDGSDQQQETTKGMVMKYLAPIVGLNFEWVPSSAARTADIRVSYNYSGGGLSCVGKGSKSCDLGGGASLKIAPNSGTYVTLHEFGHAMGLSHEHQTTCDNPLDVTGLGQWFQRNTLIDPNLCSPWDKDSIMNYNFTSKNGIKVTPMQVYSKVDIEWLSKIYPPKNTIPDTKTSTKTPIKKQGPRVQYDIVVQQQEKSEWNIEPIILLTSILIVIIIISFSL